MKHLTKKERKKLAKEKKRTQKIEKEMIKKSENKFHFKTLLVSIGILFLLALFGWIIMENKATRQKKPVHWHMPISYEFCGKPFTPVEKKEHGLVHGHDDGLAHVEGRITNEKLITLGKFMDAIGMPFGMDKIGQFKNGDRCPESKKPGKVQVLIDGRPNFEFRDHVFSNKEKIKIIFE